MQAFSIAANGMAAQIRRVNTIANNLANGQSTDSQAPTKASEDRSSQAPQATSEVAALGVSAPGYIEEAPVDPVDDLVALMMAQRAYEMNAKMLATADRMMNVLMETT